MPQQRKRARSPRVTRRTGLEELARLLLNSEAIVVFVTGAGLSVASGIKPFRGREDAVWNASLYEYGTRKKFSEGPREWYDEFWLKHGFHVATHSPNSGHDAIAELSQKFPSRVFVVTQNVDGLHREVPKDNLLEVHGSASTFKCFTAGCVFAKEKCVESVELEVSSENELANVPRCPACDAPLCPNVLLFDEDYDSHDSYEFSKMERVLISADAVVFVGTSFAVRLTDFAFQAAEERLPQPAITFNFNLENNAPPAKTSKVKCNFVQGKAEETLVKLASRVRQAEETLRASRARARGPSNTR